MLLVSAAANGDRYVLYASAVTGRSVTVEVGKTELAYTDGQTIHVPEAPKDDILIGLTVQGALLAVGSLEPELVAHVVGRHLVGRRYLTLEAARALQLLGWAWPTKVRAAIAGHWAGSPPESADESLHRALNGEHVPPASELFGTIRPRAIIKGAGVGVASAQRAKEGNPPNKRDGVPELDDDTDSDESRMLNQNPFGFKRENAIMRLLKTFGTTRRSKPGSGDSGAEMSMGGATPTNKVGVHARLLTTPFDLALEPSREAHGSLVYPEWDGNRGFYRPRWCEVAEYDPPLGELAPWAARPDLVLRRKLAKLGLAYARHGRQEDGDGLDVGALVDFAAARALGVTPDPRIYHAWLRTARDLGAVVLLDASGSTAECLAGGTPIWDEQRRLAANLVGALEAIGCRVAAFGFRSNGRHDVSFLRVKDFDGRFDQRVMRRLAALEPSGYTRLGAAVRHGTHMVVNGAGTSYRLLVVVSDGLAYDSDYQGAYAERDTRRALKEAVAKGVGSVCVTLGSSTDLEALERTWGSTSHVRLGHASEFTDQVVPLFSAALKAATAITTSRSGAVETKGDRSQ